jgi:aminoglycoside 3-N-acetyltransferase
VTYRDFITGFRKLDIDPSSPLVAHASLAAFGEVHGGAGSVLDALVSAFNAVIMPTFTYKTMVIPEVGPTNNALVYGSGKDANRMAEIYHPGMPADTMMGVVAEGMRTQAGAQRSSHPILSFAGVNASEILAAQTIDQPLLPIQRLIDDEGWVLLLGVDHTVNTSIHYCEHLAGRKQFIRWALTPQGVVSCPGFPGCSDGFEAVAPHLKPETRRIELGGAIVQAIPLVSLVEAVCTLIKQDATALLCERADCERCSAVKASVVAL